MATSQDFVNWVPTPAVTSSWLKAIFNCGRATLARFGKGSTHTTIYYPEWMSVHIALPPIVEQRAIAARIEMLFSQLDQGVAQLKAVRARLDRYRESVLKAAFEGRLTAEWREQRRREAMAKGETALTAEDLLARICAGREGAYARRLAEWEQATADWKAAGGRASGQQQPRKPARSKDPPPLPQEELDDLPQLPEEWVWCRLDSLSVVSGGLTKNAKRDALPLQLPYLRVANVYSGRLQLDEIKDIGVTEAEREKTLLAPDDLLFVEGNGSADQIGRVARWTGAIEPCLHQNHLIRARPSAGAVSAYLVHWFLSPTGRERIMRQASSTSGLHTLSISKVSALLAPVAPPFEQAEVVNEIDARLSVVDQVEHTIAAALKQAESLRQSILKRAFEGRLLSEAELAAVRADPEYEPADRLLARIRGDTAPGSKRTASKPAAARIPKGERYRQAACAAYAVRRLASQPTFGRVQQMKFLYLVPHVVERESHIHAERQAAGPLDPAIHKIESLASKQGWFTARARSGRTVYRPGRRIDEACATAESVFGAGKAKVDWLLDQFAKFDTEQAELVATTFAVWNDLLIDGEETTAEKLIAGVHGWHPEKAAKFPAGRVEKCMKWLRDHDLVPTGTGPRTRAVEGTA